MKKDNGYEDTHEHNKSILDISKNHNFQNETNL